MDLGECFVPYSEDCCEFGELSFGKGWVEMGLQRSNLPESKRRNVTFPRVTWSDPGPITEVFRSNGGRYNRLKRLPRSGPPCLSMWKKVFMFNIRHYQSIVSCFQSYRLPRISRTKYDDICPFVHQTYGVHNISPFHWQCSDKMLDKPI